MQKAALWPRPHEVCSQLISTSNAVFTRTKFLSLSKKQIHHKTINDAPAIILGTNVNTALFALVTYYFFAFFKNFFPVFNPPYIFKHANPVYAELQGTIPCYPIKIPARWPNIPFTSDVVITSTYHDASYQLFILDPVNLIKFSNL